MPKMKTNSGAKKRFRLTRKGKLLRAKAFKGHLLESKTSKRKRKLRKVSSSSDVEYRRVKQMMPYA